MGIGAHSPGFPTGTLRISLTNVARGSPRRQLGKGFLSGVLSIVPRLFCTAWHTWHRVEAVRNIDSETTLTVMKMLFRSDHSVAAESIADGLGDVDLNKVLRDVSLLDGIVFLTRGGISLSIAPRLNEDFEAWRSVGRKHSDNEGLFSR